MSKDAHELEYRPLPRRLKIALILTPLVVAWAISAWVISEAAAKLGSVWGGEPFNLGAMATLLFGASSLALIIFSVLLAGGAVVGWEGMKSHVRREIETETHERISRLERSLQGRAYAVIGMMIGTSHSNPVSLEQASEDLAYLSEAIHHCQQGYDLLKGLSGNGKYMALNNLAYFRCLTGKDLKPKRLLEDAAALKAIAETQEMAYGAPYFLTYCRVLLQVGRMSPEWKEDFDIALGKKNCSGRTDIQRRKSALQEALEIASEIERDPKVTELQKRKTTFYVTSISDLLQ